MIKPNSLKTWVFSLSLLLVAPLVHAVEITVPAKQVAKKIGTTCKKLPKAKGACVIAFFNGMVNKSTAKDYAYYRVLQGQSAAGYYVIQDFYRSGVKLTDPISVSNPKTLASSSDATDLGLEGLATSGHENGQKQSEATFKAGQVEGLEIFWYENGQKASETPYKNDQKEGLETEWYENGQKESEAMYKNDEIIGTSKYWNKKGEPVQSLEAAEAQE